jgi:DNA-directed RNA polymerase specialized sigma24 family protein
MPRPSFASVALPHLDAAYNLARWLLRDAIEAEDAVPDALLRALKYFPSFRGKRWAGVVVADRPQRGL